MAIKAYTGIMGSGKTYEVASVVIYNAIKQGRRVISNIAGLNIDEYINLINANNETNEKLGTIVSVSHDQVTKANFWLTDYDNDLNRFNTTDVIQAGDLVVLDEVWRFWNGFSLKGVDGKKQPYEVMNFFRMHRQMPHPTTGVTCDIVLISQDIADLHRQVKSVIEETYCMSKMTAIGREDRYRVDIFSRTKTRGKPQKQLFRSYDKKFFPLYASHSRKTDTGAESIEVNIDKRGNILSSKFFYVAVPIALLIMAGSVKFLWDFFHKNEVTEKETQLLTTNQQPKKNIQDQIIQNQNASIQNRPLKENHVYKLIGKFKKQGFIYYIVENEKGQIRHLVNPNIAVYGIDTAVETDEIKATSWSKNNENSDHSLMPININSNNSSQNLSRP